MFSSFFGLQQTPFRQISLGDFTSSHVERTVYVKLENCHPTGTVKDRAAWWLIQKALANRKLTRGGMFVDASSGNFGVSLCYFARKLGYRATIVLSRNTSREHCDRIKKFGGDVLLTSESGDEDAMCAVAREYAMRQHNAYFVDQYGDPESMCVHERTTAVEILEQVPNISAFVTVAGSGGLIIGVGRRLREKYPHVAIIRAKCTNMPFTPGPLYQQYAADLDIIEIGIENGYLEHVRSVLSPPLGVQWESMDTLSLAVCATLDEEFTAGNVVTMVTSGGDWLDRHCGAWKHSLCQRFSTC